MVRGLFVSRRDRPRLNPGDVKGIARKSAALDRRHSGPNTVTRESADSDFENFGVRKRGGNTEILLSYNLSKLQMRMGVT